MANLATSIYPLPLGEGEGKPVRGQLTTQGLLHQLADARRRQILAQQEVQLVSAASAVMSKPEMTPARDSALPVA